MKRAKNKKHIPEIRIEYDGKWPTLCMGKLIVYIDDKKYVFPNFCLVSGGSAYFVDDKYDNAVVELGEWGIGRWPDDFPDDEELRELVEKKVNEEIPHGCCGGCL